MVLSPDCTSDSRALIFDSSMIFLQVNNCFESYFYEFMYSFFQLLAHCFKSGKFLTSILFIYRFYMLIDTQFKIKPVFSFTCKGIGCNLGRLFFGVWRSGSAPVLGTGGPRFDPEHPDHPSLGFLT